MNPDPQLLDLFRPSAQLVHVKYIFLLVYMHSLGVNIWLPVGNQTIQ
jgi:hypothetical protein